MCQKAVEIILELVILMLSCFGHLNNVWFFGQTYQGGLWLVCTESLEPSSHKTEKDLSSPLKCSDYNKTVAETFSHHYTETLISKGFLISSNVLAGIMIILLIISVTVRTPDCAPVVPAIFQVFFLTSASAFMTHAFITFHPNSDNRVGSSLIVLWVSVPVSFGQFVVIVTMFCKCWKTCPLQLPKSVFRFTFPFSSERESIFVHKNIERSYTQKTLKSQ